MITTLVGMASRETENILSFPGITLEADFYFSNQKVLENSSEKKMVLKSPFTGQIFSSFCFNLLC